MEIRVLFIIEKSWFTLQSILKYLTLQTASLGILYMKLTHIHIGVSVSLFSIKKCFARQFDIDFITDKPVLFRHTLCTGNVFLRTQHRKRQIRESRIPACQTKFQ